MNIQEETRQMLSALEVEAFEAEALEQEAMEMAAEILEELDLERHTKKTGTMTISLGRANSDLTCAEDTDRELIARFQRRIARGEYKVDPMAIATGLVLSGDLDR